MYLITALAVVIIGGLYYLNEQEHRGITMMMQDEDIENTQLLEKIIHFESEGLNAFANDYTYWDDMVNFTKNYDTAWSNANIVASIPTYKVDYVWVFGKDYSPGYFTSREDIPKIDSGLISKEMLTKLTAGNRLFHFFIQSPAGIIEVSGATIHPTLDPKRLTEPQGYFAVGRLWTKDVLVELSELTSAAVGIIELSKKDSIERYTNEHGFFTSSLLTLSSWDNKPLVYVLSSKEVTIVKLLHEKSDSEFIVIVIFVSVLLLLSGGSLFYLVNLPLKKISRSLRENDPKHIKGLLDSRNEFGEMARLVNEFFVQKQKLLDEIEVRAEAERKAHHSENELKRSLKEKEVLLKEIHHRVKNNLQIIISLIRLQTNRLTDKETIRHLHTSLNRIKSIALVHEMLYRSHDLSKIDFNEYIRKITLSLRAIYSNDMRDVKIEVSADDIFLGVESAVPCAVIINELVTNSIKHAFNGAASGKIEISMKKAGGLYTLRVADNGMGISDSININETNSLGMHLITSLSDQLDAESSLQRDNGTVFTLKFQEEE